MLWVGENCVVNLIFGSDYGCWNGVDCLVNCLDGLPRLLEWYRDCSVY